MSRGSAHLFLVLSLIFLSSCIEITPSIPTPVGPTVTVDPNAAPTLTPFAPATDTASVPAATPSIPSETATHLSVLTVSQTPAFASVTRPQYIIDVTLNYSSHSLSVDEVINYQNLTGVNLDSLVLAVEPNLWKNCFKLDGVMVSGQMVDDYKLASDRLDLPLSTPLAPAAAINLLLHFDLSLPPADVHHVFGYNEMQANLVDWYPFIVPYSQGWQLHPPAGVGEHLVYEAADFDVTIHPGDAAPAVTLAAGTPGELVNGAWHYRLARARTFAWSASPFYETATTSVNGVPLMGYYFQAEKSQAGMALGEVAKAVTTYSSLFGPYPYASLSMVESPFYDGMEYDGLFFLSRDFYNASDGTVLNNLVDIAVHETAHQWWFGSVGSDQALEPWLDEALATYSERLFYEQNYANVVNSWQTFRVDSFDPSGWVDTDIYHGVNFRTYANAVYLQGARFLQALRERIGDPAFFAFLKDYASQMGGRISTSADFFRLLHAHTNVNISDILAKYFSQPPQ